mmetsp:Transcript_80465/g.151973  ORF Transcript_80465/g.151973 Transcript_80465/m.151973 type:complete len:201 (+) Transcript_80465:389-991(+)
MRTTIARTTNYPIPAMTNDLEILPEVRISGDVESKTVRSVHIHGHWLIASHNANEGLCPMLVLSQWLRYNAPFPRAPTIFTYHCEGYPHIHIIPFFNESSIIGSIIGRQPDASAVFITLVCDLCYWPNTIKVWTGGRTATRSNIAPVPWRVPLRLRAFAEEQGSTTKAPNTFWTAVVLKSKAILDSTGIAERLTFVAFAF